MKLSFQQIKDLIYTLLPNTYIVDLYDDKFIYEQGDKYYQVSYAIADGNLSLGDKVEVEKKVEYVKAQAAMSLTAAVGDPGNEDYGYVWEVRVIDYGPDRQQRIYWDPQKIKAAKNLYEGAKVFALSEAQHQNKPSRFGKSVRDMVGWIDNIQDDGKGFVGHFNILKAAKWLRDMVVDSRERGKPDLIGLSNDVDAKITTKMVAGKKMLAPEKITGVTVDVVYEPAGGGKFMKMVAAAEADRKEDEMFKKLLAALKGRRPDLAGQIDALEAKDDAVTEEEMQKLLAAAVQKPEDAKDLIAQLTAAMKSNDGGGADAQKLLDEAKKTLETAQLTAAAMTLDREISASGLPGISQAKMRKQFEGRIFETETLQAAIKEEKEYLDKLTGSGAPVGSGDVKDVVGEPSRLQAAVDKMLGVKTEERFNDVPGFDSLRAAYVRLTGDTEVRGFIDDPAKLDKLRAAYSSTTFSYVLGNTLYRRMVQDYKEIDDYGVSRIIGQNIRNAKDFRTLESVRIAYYGDLPDITPETVDYPDLGTLTDEEVSYALNQKGGTITITRKMIINDDMYTVNKILKRIPRAARRTLAKRVWNKFINNDTYKGDALAIYHASHNNLVVTGLSTAALVAAKTAMANQTEPGSGEKLHLRMKTLAIPTDLWETASKINKTTGDPGTPNFGNAMYQYFGANNENILECPFMTDANDWIVFCDPNDAEIAELAFLNGQQEPEMFVADNPTVGQFFVADKLQYKIRHEYEVEIDDFRGTYKGQVV